jgi:hypothetical protein
LFRHSVFANWRNSPRLSPIGEKLVDIRQLAKSTIGEKEDWRWDIFPPYSDVHKLRLHIVFVFILHGPIIFTFMMYIYPSEKYMGEFQETCLYQVLCCCFYRRRKAKELMKRRQRVASVATIQRLLVETERF